jgi:hypothetical protein
MLIDIIDRVNELRQKALSDPVFLQSAVEHEEVIQNIEIPISFEKRRKLLADIYGNHDTNIK